MRSRFYILTIFSFAVLVAQPNNFGRVDYQSAVNPSNVDLVDVDGDGKNDVIISGYNSDNVYSVLIYQNTTTTRHIDENSLQLAVTLQDVRFPVIADIDNDGIYDVACIRRADNMLMVFRGLSNNPITFDSGTSFTIGSDARLTAVSDIDGDGKIDIIIPHGNDQNFSYLLNNSTSGTIDLSSPTSVSVGENSYTMSVGDLDGDNLPEIIVPKFTSNNSGTGNYVYVWKNTSTSGNPSFASPATFSTGTNPIISKNSLVDIDGDSKSDIVTANSGSNSTSVLRNTSSTGSLSFEDKVDYTAGSALTGIANGDVDGDGKKDIVIPNRDSDTFILFINQSNSGTISLNDGINIATQSYPVGSVVGDINGDAFAEIIIINGHHSSHPNSGKTFSIFNNIPTITSVTSSTSDGTYKAGDAIAITVTFSIAVTVTGTPQLTLETGSADAVVDYSSGTGGTTLTFNYTVASGHASSNLNYKSTTALALNGGTIKDSDGNAATLTLPSPGAAGSLGANKALVVDGVVPTVSGVTSTTANGTYKVGDAISIIVGLSEVVTVTETPRIKLETGTTDQYASYASGTGNDTLTFTYTVASGDTTADLDYTSTTALELNSGTIKDAAGNATTLTLASPGESGSLGTNKAFVIDGNVPTVASVTSTRTNGGDTVGETIPITITFNQTVTVTGTPQLTLETGTTDAVVDYASGTGTATLTFNYVVAAGHTSSDLDYTSTSALALNSGTIKDASGNAVTLTLPTPGATNSLGANKTLIIDTTSPTVPSVSSTKADAAYKVGESIPINVDFDDKVYVTGTPQLEVAAFGNSNIRSSLSFDGTDDYVTIGTPTNINPSNVKTVSAWIYPDNEYGTENNGNIVASSPGFMFGYSEQNFLFNIDGRDASSIVDNAQAKTPNFPTDKSWNHVAGTYDGSNIKLYYNGALVLDITHTTLVPTDTLQKPIYIASNPNSDGTPTQMYGGKIDEVAIWDKTLTLAEITKIYNNGKIVDLTANTEDYISATNLTAYYKFDEGSGNTVKDQSGKGNDGTVVGATWSSDSPIDDATISGTKVNYTSGSESTSLIFTYSVSADDNTPDLDYTSSSALTLNSGTVKDSLGNAATLTLPDPGAFGSLGANKAIIIDNLPPVLSINPTDGSTAVLPTSTISINFNEYVRLSDNTEATSSNVDALITLKDTDVSGTDISFDATINSTKTTITIDPTVDFSSEQTVYVAISASLEDSLDHATSAASATLKMKDVIVPTVTFDPTNGSYDIPGNRNITLTFSETIRNIDNSEITDSNVAGLIVLKGNNSSGADFNFGATINADKTVITVDPLFDFSASSVVYVGIGAVVEDDADNAIVASSVIYITGIPDVIGPAVSNVTSANADSSYKDGSSIVITVSFDEAAIVTGTPQLTLETGTTDGVANYSSGSGTKDLYFTYNVTSDHNIAHLDYESSNALIKNEGTIKDAIGNNATLTLPNPGAENSLGANKNIVIDHFIPVISLVAEGSLTGEDKDYQTVATTMDISWAGTDTISGLSKYEYALGTTSGGTEVKTWTNAATVTSVSLSDLSLSDGSKYYASVKATDKADNVSTVKIGDGITIDITAPTTGTISDGTVADISFTASSNSLSAKWTGFSDANSGIANYEYAIGTTSGGTDTKNWTSNGIDTTVTVTSLALTSGQVYYISVRATDLAGNVSSVITTNGVTVDLAGPIKGTVLDGLTADADWTTNIDTIRASWAGFTDPLSGIKKYQYGIGKSSGASDVVAWTDNSLDTTITLKLTLEEAVTYYVSVRGVDKVDNIGEVATSDGITADFTPPTIVSASIEDNATLPILSDSEIIFTISEPITAATSTTESKLGDSATGTLTLDDATQISVKLANPFTSGDELTLTINDLKDRSGNVTSNLVYNYNIAMIADYNVDGSIDAADLTVLINGWTNKDYAFELGPAAGDVPNLKPATDGKYDIMDAAVLIRMWHWNLNKSGKMLSRYINLGKELTYINENNTLSIQVSKDVNAVDFYFDYPQDKVSIKQSQESSSDKEIILSHLDTLNGKFIMTAGYLEQKLQSIEVPYIINGREDVTITAIYRMFDTSGEVFSQGTKEITLKPVPQEFALHQNYPNPFNPVTTINYDLPQQTYVNLMIYDILGREVVKLVSKEIPAGYQSVIWNTRNNFGTPVSAGIYFYQIQTKGFVKTRKMVLLK